MKDKIIEIIDDVFNRYDMGTYIAVQNILADEIMGLFPEYCSGFTIDTCDCDDCNNTRTQITKRMIEEFDEETYWNNYWRLSPREVLDVFVDWLNTREE